MHLSRFTKLTTWARYYETPLFMSIGVTILSVLIGVPLAWIVGRTGHALQRLHQYDCYSAFYHAAGGGCSCLGLSRHSRVGFVNSILKWLAGTNEPLFDIFTMGGLILVMALSLAPYVFIFTVTAFKNMDPTLENAAHVRR